MFYELLWYEGMRVRTRRRITWPAAGRNLEALAPGHRYDSCPGRTCRNPECGPVRWTEDIPADTAGTIVPAPERQGGGERSWQFVPDAYELRADPGVGYYSVAAMTHRDFERRVDEPLTATGTVKMTCQSGDDPRCVVILDEPVLLRPGSEVRVTITWQQPAGPEGGAREQAGS